MRRPEASPGPTERPPDETGLGHRGERVAECVGASTARLECPLAARALLSDGRRIGARLARLHQVRPDAGELMCRGQRGVWRSEAGSQGTAVRPDGRRCPRHRRRRLAQGWGGPPDDGQRPRAPHATTREVVGRGHPHPCAAGRDGGALGPVCADCREEGLGDGRREASHRDRSTPVRRARWARASERGGCCDGEPGVTRGNGPGGV